MAENKENKSEDNSENKITIEDMAIFCKRKGFVYKSAEIYGGLSGFFDFGPLGVELKNNIKKEWWNFHVHSREDVVGIDGSIITNPRVWKASGHVDNFADMMLVCTKCKTKIRADHFIEDKLKIAADGGNSPEIDQIFTNALFKDFLIKVKVKAEMVNDENRVKSTILSCTPLNYVTECQELLAAINKY